MIQLVPRDIAFDITKLGGTPYESEAIVNAANSHLKAGSGVCGSIFEAAGLHDLQQACDAIGGCPTGEARLTPAFNLATQGVKGIIHAVGPRFNRDAEAESEHLLRSAYQAAVKCAQDAGFRTIAFPSISTGVYDFPWKRAAEISVEALREVDGPNISIHLVAFKEEAAKFWGDALGA